MSGTIGFVVAAARQMDFHDPGAAAGSSAAGSD